MGERTRGRFPNRGEEEEDERGRFSCLGPAGDVKKGVAGSRFVGNSFLLFEPVFSLARRLYISAPSLSRRIRANKHSGSSTSRSIVPITRKYISVGGSNRESRDSRLFLRTRTLLSLFFFSPRGRGERTRARGRNRLETSRVAVSPCKHLRFNVFKFEIES